MDTKEKNRRGSSRQAPRRETGAANQNPRRRRRTAGTGSGRTRPAAARQSNQAKRVVRAPREEAPKVTYTMPKPMTKGGLLLKLASVVAAVAAVVMCLSLFFRVDQVVVYGAEKYTPWMVKEASGIQDGDSLLSIRDARVSGNIISSLPYVKDVRVGIKLPGTVNIEITELEVAYAIQARDTTWWLIAADGRVVESIESTAASGYTRILGVQADAPRADQPIRAVEQSSPETETDPSETDEPASSDEALPLPSAAHVTGQNRLDTVLLILQSLEKNSVLGQIATIDVTDLNDITMEYSQRLIVRLGTSENLDYKIAYMAQAVEQIEEYQIGELDVSFKYSEQALLNPQS